MADATNSRDDSSFGSRESKDESLISLSSAKTCFHVVCYNETPEDVPVLVGVDAEIGIGLPLLAVAKVQARPLKVRGPISWIIASRTRSVRALTSSDVRPVVGIGSSTCGKS